MKLSLQLWHHLWVLVHVLPALLLTQLLADSLGKGLEDGPNVWAPATHEGDPDEVLGSCFHLAQYWLSLLSGEWTSRWKISLSLPLSL